MARPRARFHAVVTARCLLANRATYVTSLLRVSACSSRAGQAAFPYLESHSRCAALLHTQPHAAREATAMQSNPEISRRRALGCSGRQRCYCLLHLPGCMSPLTAATPVSSAYCAAPPLRHGEALLGSSQRRAWCNRALNVTRRPSCERRSRSDGLRAGRASE